MSHTVPDQLFDHNNVEELIATILAEAKRQGATSAEVDVGVTKGYSVQVRMGEVETVEYNQDKVIGLSVYFGQRSGAASMSDSRPEAITAAVKAACNIARYTDTDNCGGLADKELLAFGFKDPDLYHPWKLTVQDAIELATSCEGLALSLDKRVHNSEGVSVATSEGIHGYGNSHGFIGALKSTHHEMSCVLLAKSQDEMQRDYSFTLATDPLLLDHPDKLAKEAVKNTIARLDSRRVPTCRVPVIYAAEEARGLLGHFVAAIQGGNLYRKSSFLVDHLGKQIFPEHIRIEEKPFLPKYLGSSPFDNDGVQTRENVFIDSGRLTSYALGSYSGRKLKLPTTGNAGGVHNLFITTGNKNLAQLIKTMHRGFLVTELMGQGVNLVTGSYSRGAAGFWIENGEIQYAVEEVTIAGNLPEMYANLVEVGNDVDRRGNIQTGSILIHEMMIAGE
jgi:PmbA protein